MPYRVDLGNAGDDALDRLIELGAVDAEISDDGSIAALMPDRVSPQQIAHAMSIDDIAVIRSMHADVPNHEPSLMLMNCGDARLPRPSPPRTPRMRLRTLTFVSG